MKLRHLTGKFFSIIAITALLISCKKNDNSSPTPDPDPDPSGEERLYSAILCVGSWPNTAYYIANLPSLTEGTITVKGNGAEMTGKVYAQDILQKDGYYYHANSGSGRLGKYHVANGAVVVDKEIPFTWLDWDSYVWVDDGTFIIFGSGKNESEVNEARYAIVKVADMSVTTGKLAFSPLPSGFTGIRIGAAEYRSGKIFVGYQFASEDWSLYPDMPVYHKFNLAVINYPDMSVEKNLEESRSTTPGGPIVYAPVSFKDENEDIYFVTDPVFNYDYEAPSVIYRIKNGETELDESYFFNLSEKADNGMGAAMWYLGGGKAIIRTTVEGQSIDADHFYSLVNVQTGTFIKKLDLPADKGERMVNAIVVEDGKAYIAVNAQDKDYIWEYDPATDKLTAGAEFIGGIDYILRLEKIK